MTTCSYSIPSTKGKTPTQYEDKEKEKRVPWWKKRQKRGNSSLTMPVSGVEKKGTSWKSGTKLALSGDSMR